MVMFYTMTVFISLLARLWVWHRLSKQWTCNHWSSTLENLPQEKKGEFIKQFWKFLPLQGGCVHIYMCFYHSQLIDLDPKTHVQFCLKVATYLLSRGKNKDVTLGMRLLRKYIWKWKLVYRKRFLFFVFLFIFSIITSKVYWIWSWNFGKNMGFHLIHKKVLLSVKPWGMRMQWEHPTLNQNCSYFFFHYLFPLR